MIYDLKIKKLVIIFIILGIILPIVAFTQAQTPIKAPETMEEAKEFGQKTLEVGKKELPGIIEKIWREEVLPIWQKMGDWFKKNIWEPYIKPFFRKEIEKRKPVIKEEFQKEKEEMKESVKKEVPKVGKSLWEKFKELIK